MASVKDSLALHMPGVYWIPCAFGKSYVSLMGCSIAVGCKALPVFNGIGEAAD